MFLSIQYYSPTMFDCPSRRKTCSGPHPLNAGSAKSNRRTADSNFIVRTRSYRIDDVGMYSSLLLFAMGVNIMSASVRSRERYSYTGIPAPRGEGEERREKNYVQRIEKN
jgi:hypothetical protein